MKIVSIALYGAACFVAAPLAAQTLAASAPVNVAAAVTDVMVVPAGPTPSSK